LHRDYTFLQVATTISWVLPAVLVSALLWAVADIGSLFVIFNIPLVVLLFADHNLYFEWGLLALSSALWLLDDSKWYSSKFVVGVVFLWILVLWWVLHVLVFREVDEPEMRFIVSMLRAGTAFLTTFVAGVTIIIVALPSSTLSVVVTAVVWLLLIFVVVRGSLSFAAVLKFIIRISLWITAPPFFELSSFSLRCAKTLLFFIIELPAVIYMLPAVMRVID
jgi:hypothetical protein